MRCIALSSSCRFFASTAVDPDVNVKYVQAVKIGLAFAALCVRVLFLMSFGERTFGSTLPPPLHTHIYKCVCARAHASVCVCACPVQACECLCVCVCVCVYTLCERVVVVSEARERVRACGVCGAVGGGAHSPCSPPPPAPRSPG